MSRAAALVAFCLTCLSCQADQGGSPASPTGPAEGPGSSGALAPAGGRYIVTLRRGLDPRLLAALHSLAPDYVYTHALNGFAVVLPEGTRRLLALDSRVLRIEPDAVVTASDVQASAPWSLDRIDQHARPLDATFTYGSTGAGVTAYVIDTGMRFDHAEFGGRTISVFDAVNGGPADDCDGHGTHVAGTIGGATFGVAKGVLLGAVRVLDCYGSGTWSGVIKGIDAVIAHHPNGVPAVANLSLGGPANASVDAAVANLIADGVATAVAAGNESRSACRGSPARVPGAMTVSATDSLDRRASWANWGPCVDWFAPGVRVQSAGMATATATATLSGTSMAAPHTAGVAALYLAVNPGASPQTVATALAANATAGVVTNRKKSPNLLLFTNH